MPAAHSQGHTNVLSRHHWSTVNGEEHKMATIESGMGGSHQTSQDAGSAKDLFEDASMWPNWPQSAQISGAYQPEGPQSASSLSSLTSLSSLSSLSTLSSPPPASSSYRQSTHQALGNLYNHPPSSATSQQIPYPAPSSATLSNASSAVTGHFGDLSSDSDTLARGPSTAPPQAGSHPTLPMLARRSASISSMGSALTDLPTSASSFSLTGMSAEDGGEATSPTLGGSPSSRRETRSASISSTGNRNRHKTTPEQLSALEALFADNPKPSTKTRKALAEQINMPERSIQIWFQNRRSRSKLRDTIDEERHAGFGDQPHALSMGSLSLTNDGFDMLAPPLHRHGYSDLARSSGYPMAPSSNFGRLPPLSWPLQPSPAHGSSGGRQTHLSRAPPTQPFHSHSSATKSRSLSVTSGSAPSFASFHHPLVNDVAVPNNPASVNQYLSTTSAQSSIVQVPATSLLIGEWQRLHPLTCYFSKKNQGFGWSLVSESVGFKLELPCTSLRALVFRGPIPSSRPGEQEGILYVMLERPPQFFMEVFPSGNRPDFQPSSRKKSWRQCEDFTEGRQATQIYTHIVSGSYEPMRHAMTEIANSNGATARKLRIDDLSLPSGGLAGPMSSSAPQPMTPSAPLSAAPRSDFLSPAYDASTDLDFGAAYTNTPARDYFDAAQIHQQQAAFALGTGSATSSFGFSPQPSAMQHSAASFAQLGLNSPDAELQHNQLRFKAPETPTMPTSATTSTTTSMGPPAVPPSALHSATGSGWESSYCEVPTGQWRLPVEVDARPPERTNDSSTMTTSGCGSFGTPNEMQPRSAHSTTSTSSPTQQRSGDGSTGNQDARSETTPQPRSATQSTMDAEAKEL